MTLVAYVQRRLGTRSPMLMLWRTFARAFSASSPSAFWKSWNPLYGYGLARCVHRPLRRLLPPRPALVVTFAFSGFFLHDLLAWPAWIAMTGRPPFPFVTVAFVAFSLIALGADALGTTFARLSRPARCAAHVTWITAGFGIAAAVAKAL